MYHRMYFVALFALTSLINTNWTVSPDLTGNLIFVMFWEHGTVQRSRVWARTLIVSSAMYSWESDFRCDMIWYEMKIRIIDKYLRNFVASYWKYGYAVNFSQARHDCIGFDYRGDIFFRRSSNSGISTQFEIRQEVNFNCTFPSYYLIHYIVSSS